jgi:hypothetical protein
MGTQADRARMPSLVGATKNPDDEPAALADLTS